MSQAPSTLSTFELHHRAVRAATIEEAWLHLPTRCIVPFDRVNPDSAGTQSPLIHSTDSVPGR
eukprot:1458798-Rhodomonas_salina.1